MIVIAIIFGWALCQVDFMLAYKQTPIQVDMCMEILQGITTKEGVSNDYLLQLISNLYEQKQADKVWNQYLEVELLTGGFTQSLIDECVFFKGPVIFIAYFDDRIFLGAMICYALGLILNTKDILQIILGWISSIFKTVLMNSPNKHWSRSS